MGDTIAITTRSTTDEEKRVMSITLSRVGPVHDRPLLLAATTG